MNKSKSQLTTADNRIVADAKDILAMEASKTQLFGSGTTMTDSRTPQQLSLKEQKRLLASDLVLSGLSTRSARRTAAATINNSRIAQSKASVVQQQLPPPQMSRVYERPANRNYNVPTANVTRSAMRQEQQRMKKSGIPYYAPPKNFGYAMSNSLRQAPMSAYKAKRNMPDWAHKNDNNIATAYDNDPRNGKPISQSSKWAQPLSGSDMLTAWDRYTVARAYPGSVNSPYVNNMTLMPLPTGVFSISKALAEVWDEQQAAPDFVGQGNYVCLFFCPSLSSFKGPGGLGNLSTSTRLSGFASVQTDSLNFNCSDGLFIADKYASSCVGLYGSDFTSFASGGFVWSGQMSTHIVAPAATLVGACYKGTITLGQLSTGGVTLSTLIQDATVTCTGSYEHVLRSSVIEPSLVKDINQPAKVDYPRFPDSENETVSYVIYQTAVQNISGPTPTNYSFILHVDGNFVYYPKATDSFAFNLTSQNLKGNSVFTREGNVAGAIENTINTTVKSSVKHEEGWDKAKKLDESFILDKKTDKEVRDMGEKGVFGTIYDSFAELTNENSVIGKIIKSPYVSAIAGMLLAPRQEQLTSLVPKDDFLYYFRQLREICHSFRGTVAQEGEFVPFKAWVDQCYEWYCNQPDWIDPAGENKKKPREDKHRAKSKDSEKEESNESFRKLR